MIKKYFPFIIIFLLHVAGFIYASQTLNIYLKDSFEYLKLAKNLVSDLTIYSGDLDKPFFAQFVSLRPPVYGAFIAFTKIFSSNNLIVIFAQGILSLATILLLLKIINRLFHSSYSYFVAAAILFFPSQIVYANMIMSEILFQFLILLFVYCHILFFDNQKIKYLIYASGSMCIMLLTKPVSLFILIFYTLFILIQVFKKKFNASIMVFPVIAFICLLSYQYYNYEKTGYFHYSSLTSTYLLNYQLFPTLLDARDEFDSNQSYGCIVQDTGISLSAQNKIDRINDEAELEINFNNYSKKRIALTIKELRQHKTVFLKKSLIGLFKFFVDSGNWDVNEFLISKHSTHNQVLNLYLWIVLFFKLILFSLLIYSLTLIKKQSPVFLLILFIILAVAIATGMTGSARFQLPVYPLVLILCIFSLQNPKFKLFTDKFKRQPPF